MANGLDRLERLFTYKRKGPPAPTQQVNMPVQSSEPQFPSPSFIRPKTCRMAARDEVRLRQAAGRSPSVPDIFPLRRISSTHAPNSSLSTNASNLKDSLMPLPSPSFSSRQPRHMGSALGDFEFPKLSRQADDQSSAVSAIVDTSSTDVPQLPSPRCRSPLRVAIPLGRLDTPPSSDPEDSGLFLTGFPSKALPAIAYRGPPTPEETPEFGPLSGLPLRGSRSLETMDKSISGSSLHDLGDSFDHLSLHRAYSQSSLAPSAQRSFCSSTLREPDFNEFLNLSDDDIAESTPESITLPSLDDSEPTLPPMGLSISSSRPLTSTLLTLTPPRTSRPAAVAAFEAARIARNYDFDLVYVVNLWPDSAHTVPQLEAVAQGGQALDPKPMMGRLLAAHGLHHVPSPLQISSLVHTTILRSDGWIEYRNTEAECHDLARGFACAFYTGQYTRTGQPDLNSPVSGVRLSEQIDRGIVFAAYRKPRAGEDKLGRSFSEEELGGLHREAEALVEMLIDIHVANRLRQSSSQRSIPDETGPMPLQPHTP
ncbi:hypothetical protein CDD83_8597 [Cordyceps sp. RAO-2017]|nr:hypothetical protein CDD83_8597 [Cordyceps sp. RAO-2017]